MRVKVILNSRDKWAEIRPLLSEMFWSLVGLSAMLMGAIHGIKGMWHWDEPARSAQHFAASLLFFYLSQHPSLKRRSGEKD